jgi:hypothetical protein
VPAELALLLTGLQVQAFLVLTDLQKRDRNPHPPQ